VIFKSIILENKVMRRRLLAKLSIPTYFQLKKVNFTDTLQQLCDKINLLNYRQELISEEYTKKMAIMAKLGLKISSAFL